MTIKLRKNYIDFINFVELDKNILIKIDTNIIIITMFNETKRCKNMKK